MGINTSLAFVGPFSSDLPNAGCMSSYSPYTHSAPVQRDESPRFLLLCHPPPRSTSRLHGEPAAISVSPWKDQTSERVHRQRQSQPSRALVAAFVSAGEKTRKEMGEAEVGWDENAWKRSLKKGPLGSVSLVFCFRAGRSPLSALLLLLEWLWITVEIKILGTSLKDRGAISTSQLEERSRAKNSPGAGKSAGKY